MIRKYGGFENVILVSVGGDIKLSSIPQFGLLDQHEKHLVDMTLLAKEVVFGDFFICQIYGGVHIDVMSPVLGEGGQPLAVFILRISPNTYLCTLIESGPTPSRRAETLLVCREGGQVVFLNQLRHHHVTAMSLHLPLLSQTPTPAVHAALGHEGVFDVIDYRGKAVLADIRRVPDSLWFIVTKVESQRWTPARCWSGFTMWPVSLGLLSSPFFCSPCRGAPRRWRNFGPPSTVSVTVSLRQTAMAVYGR
ncbi:MAG: hypothetical protein ACUVQ2_09065 [Dissulfurimicrobium sp.]|uniref:hypothetical protein n=1 Tax=Dissulfurimicrobium sp. TaxID=2022436 RepID=UPI004049F331